MNAVYRYKEATEETVDAYAVYLQYIRDKLASGEITQAVFDQLATEHLESYKRTMARTLTVYELALMVDNTMGQFRISN